jgi:phosphoribosylformylglycinamidine cyclo-ligase
MGDDLANQCRKILYEAAKKTWMNRRGKIGEVVTGFDDFSGKRYSVMRDGVVFGSNTDGVGSKIEVAERISTETGDFSIHQSLAYDLLEMVCGDAVASGAEPIHVDNTIAVRKKHPQLIAALADGLVEAAEKESVAVFNGELETLPDRITGFGEFPYNWTANCTWIAEPDKLLTGKTVAVGDVVVGLREVGFRSNGFTLVRKILLNTLGEEWHKKEYHGESLADALLVKSTVYTPLILDLIGRYGEKPLAEVHGIAHVTGGGIPEKLGRLLKPSGCGAALRDPFDPPRVMKYLQMLSSLRDNEVYSEWNMGHGMLIITPDAAPVLKKAREYSIEARIVGMIRKSPGIDVRNCGAYATGSGSLFFPPDQKENS